MLVTAGMAAVFCLGAANLMAQNNGQCRRRCPSLDFIKLRMADPTGGNLYEDFLLSGRRLRYIYQLQWRSVFADIGNTCKYHCPHICIYPSAGSTFMHP